MLVLNRIMRLLNIQHNEWHKWCASYIGFGRCASPSMQAYSIRWNVGNEAVAFRFVVSHAKTPRPRLIPGFVHLSNGRLVVCLGVDDKRFGSSWNLLENHPVSILSLKLFALSKNSLVSSFVMQIFQFFFVFCFLLLPHLFQSIFESMR